MLGEIYRWIWRAGLLCLAVGGFVPLAAPPKNRPTTKVVVGQVLGGDEISSGRLKNAFVFDFLFAFGRLVGDTGGLVRKIARPNL
jgi:hypothetical protein